MVFIDQSAEELRLNIINQEFNKRPLNIIVQEELEYDGLFIEFGILGASHYIQIRKGKEIFSEVFACVEVPEGIKFKDFKDKSLELKSNLIKYKFSSCILSWDEKTKKKYQEFLEDNSLIVEFPSEEGDFKAITAMKFNKETMILKTIHAYPNENVCVFTESSLLKK